MVSKAARDAWAVDALGLPYNDPNTGTDTFPAAGVPAAPTSLVATAGNESASIAFTAPTAQTFPVTDYEYRIGTGDWVSSGVNESPVVIGGLTKAVEVSITLRAVTVAGPSAASSPVTVTPFGPPSAPTSLVATPGDGQVSIAFTPSTAYGSAVTNYQYAVDGGTWTAFSPADTTSPVVITGLTNGVEVSIALRAVSAAGNSPASAPVTATPTAS